MIASISLLRSSHALVVALNYRESRINDFQDFCSEFAFSFAHVAVAYMCAIKSGRYIQGIKDLPKPTHVRFGSYGVFDVIRGYL
ncbi:hypothetical protein CITRIK5_80019 [Citricoccus sp. K5]|nr:hypothetical protein CITRIK5_80019 [Citricoccus sp. K5]